MHHCCRFGLTAALMLLSFTGYAQEQTASRDFSDHEIMIQLSASKPVDVQLSQSAQITLALPSGWQKSVKDNQSIDFKVPYHIGVWGRIELLKENTTVADDIGVMESVLNTTLETNDTQPLETSHLTGSLSVLSGRSGGETWQFLLFSGTLRNEHAIRIYAMCPQRWFPAYRLFFEDIIRSIVFPLDSRHKS